MKRIEQTSQRLSKLLLHSQSTPKPLQNTVISAVPFICHPHPPAFSALAPPGASQAPAAADPGALPPAGPSWDGNASEAPGGSGSNALLRLGCFLDVFFVGVTCCGVIIVVLP